MGCGGGSGGGCGGGRGRGGGKIGRTVYGLGSVNVTTKSRRCGKGSGMIRGRRIQFGLLEWVSNLTSGWEYSMEV